MHVLIFGAGERIGRATLELALAAGHQVTAYLPPNAPFDVQHLQLSRVDGDIARTDTLVIPMLSEVDAVINAIGSDFVAMGGRVTAATRSILTAMKRYGVKRYLGVTACTALPSRHWWGGLSQQCLRLSSARLMLQDHERAAGLVRSSGMEWTLAAVATVTAGRRTGEYGIGTEGYPGGWKRISASDAGDFLVKELARRRYVGQAVGLWY